VTKAHAAAAAESIGTALLLAVVVGSGIMGERLAAGNAGIALLANSRATGAGLYALIVTLEPISGAQFNPAISLVASWHRALPRRRLGIYIGAQLLGALAGVMAAHAMFGLPLVQISTHERATAGEGLGEMIATFGLVLTVLLTSRFRKDATPLAVAAFITSAYWFTSSTSFANPAVTLARSITDTFAGIAPASVPMFLGAQLVGAALAATFVRWLLACERQTR